MSRCFLWGVCLSMAGALITGCGSQGQGAKPSGKPAAANEPDLKLPSQVHAGAATYSVYGPMPNHVLYYKIHTTGVRADFGPDQLESGVGGPVTGTMFQHEKASFSAQGARAAKSSAATKDLDVLTLMGNVSIHSTDPEGDMHCDTLVINFKSHVIKASGHVRFNTARGMTGTLPEAWATQDLSKITSPELFQENLNQ